MPRGPSSASALLLKPRRGPPTVNVTPGVSVDDAVTYNLFELLLNSLAMDSGSKRKLAASTHLPLSHPRAAETLRTADGGE